MNALLRKEIRLILPAWIVATMLATLPVFGLGGESGYAFFALGLGLMSLGLAPFGQEFSSGTFTILLAQPVPRARIWRTKVGVLAVALVLVWSVSLLCFWSGPMPVRSEAGLVSESIVTGALLLLVAFSGGLWTTLVFRQVAAALWFTVLVPASLWVVVGVAVPGHSTEVIQPLLAIYSIAGFLFARSLFLHAEDAQWTGGSVALPAWLALGTRVRSAKPPAGPRPLRALVRKELQSHHVSLLIAAGMLLVHFVVIGVRKFTFDPSDPHNTLHSLLEFWWVLWLGLPFLVGSTAVAEERKLGTLEPQLCLPTTRRLQFVVKVVVALVLGIVLGGFMPLLTEAICGFGVVPGTFRNDASAGLGQPLLLTCLVSGAITVVSFYASTFTRNLLQAMGLAVVVGLVLMAFGTWALQEAFVGFNSLRLWVGPLVGYIGLPTLLATLFWLAFRNFKHVYVGSSVWRRNLLALLGSMAFIVVATTLIYNRAWEFFMTLEPKHGPARVSGTVTPRMCDARTRMRQRLSDGREVIGDRAFVLLPDGRLWVVNQYRFEATGAFVSSRSRSNRVEHTEEIYRAIPVGGVFLDRSNWVDLASSWMRGLGFADQVVGIQSDGTLWNILTENRTNGQANLIDLPKAERIGTDSDWKTVVGGGNYFLALKQDGSLWGWGGNESGQLGRNPKSDITGRVFYFGDNLVGGLVRVGQDSDWVSVFPTRGVVTGVKRDGSVWRWGYLSSPPPGYLGRWTPGPHAKPVRWSLDGSQWRALNGMRGYDLILKQDGTLWVTGHVWGGSPSVFGHHLFDGEYRDHFVAAPLRIGSDSDWADITSGLALLGLKRNGTLFQSASWGIALSAWGEVWRPSTHSDWIAIASRQWDSPLTLAADGTLCAWGDPGQQAYDNLNDDNRGFLHLRLLGPSRKPVWSVNIFADATSRDRSPTAQP